MTIGETIRNIRQVKGLSQKELADICGVSMGAVSAWEQGRNEPRPPIHNQIHFNCSKIHKLQISNFLHRKNGLSINTGSFRSWEKIP